tara:strand:- start:1697 stop:1900 length:204 start_codon:yes stop_codon:yes gene_type:complete
MKQEYKYIVTVGDHPHYKQMVRSNSLEIAEKRQNKLAKQFTDDQVDLYEVVNGEWEHKSLVSVISFG